MAETTEELVSQESPSSIEHVDPIQIFVGKNYDYYQRKWALTNTSVSIKSFNVAAFFLGIVWMIYRKMYLYAAIVTTFLVADAIIETYYPLPEAAGKALTWGVYIAFGLLANLMYKTHVDKKLKDISANFPPEQVNAELAKQGGVNLAGAWAFGVLLILIVGLAVWAILSEV